MATSKNIRCRTCAQWKFPSQFSNTQLKRKFSSKANPGISCRNCVGDTPKERVCEGPCGKSKPLDGFSSSSRRNGNLWCLDCTSWQLFLEPGKSIAAPGEPLDSRDVAQAQGGDEELFNDVDDETAAGSSVSRFLEPSTSSTPALHHNLPRLAGDITRFGRQTFRAQPQSYVAYGHDGQMKPMIKVPSEVDSASLADTEQTSSKVSTNKICKSRGTLIVSDQNTAPAAPIRPGRHEKEGLGHLGQSLV